MKRFYISIIVSTLLFSTLLFSQGIEVSPGPNMVTARVGSKGMLLPGGKAAIIGGHGSSFIKLNTSEIFNPATNTFTQYTMSDFRDFCGVVRLDNGKFLLIGGMSSDLGVGQLNTMELFDPVNLTFSAAGNLTVVRTMARGAQLTSGKVLIAGCWYDQTSASLADVYDPVTNTCTQTGQLLEARANPLVLPMNDGTALVYGGYGVYGGALSEAVEIYNPVNNSFTLFKERLFDTDTGYVPFLHLGEIYQEYRMKNGKYLLLAYKGTGTGTRFRLYTVDPETKAIEIFNTVPQIADYDLTLNQSRYIGYHLLDTLRNKVYLTGSEVEDGVNKIGISVIDYNAGYYSKGDIAYVMSYGFFNTPEFLLQDGRILIPGGSVSNNFDPVDSSYFIKPISTDINENVIPREFSLEQNYPNPFNPVTAIRYSIPSVNHVKLTVYDNLGREIAVLVNGEETAGTHEVKFESRNLSSGIYFYRIQAGEFNSVKKAVYLK